ncbi:MAG: sulfite exporter TauE/SafE family protein [Clostridiales bacterium]|nr:sulfite exporter TauE/SafE family protein [Clostridiales bacterium]
MNKKCLRTAVGALVGIANGLFGAGGGTILVPAMEKFFKVETHKAHATAIAVILPLSVVSAVIYMRGAPVDWRAVLYVSAGGAAGGYAGANWLNKLSAGWLHKIFGAFLVFAALRMLFGK